MKSRKKGFYLSAIGLWIGSSNKQFIDMPGQGHKSF